MEEFESEMEEFLPNIGRQNTGDDLADDYPKINRKGQSSSEYDDEDDDDFGDEDDELLENDKLMSSLSSNEIRNPVKGGVKNPQDKRNYSKNIFSLNSSKSANETNFSEAVECPKEIDVIVAECHLREGSVIHEATNQFTGDFSENVIKISEKRQRLSLTGSDDNNFALGTYSSSSDDLPELHTIECEKLLHKSVINDQKPNSFKLSEANLSDFAATDYTELQELHHGVVIKKDISANMNALFALEYLKQNPLEDEADKLNNYTNSSNVVDFTEKEQQESDGVLDYNRSSNRSSESHFEEAAEQLDHLVLDTHEYQDCIGGAKDTFNICIPQKEQQQSPIEKEGMLNNISDLIFSTEGLKEHNQSIFKYDEFQNLIGKSYDCDCNDENQLIESIEERVLKDFPQSVRNNTQTPKESLTFYHTEFAKCSVDGQKNEWPIDTEKLISANNKQSPNGSMEFGCSASEIVDCDTLRPHRESHNPPEVELRYVESSAGQYSKEIAASSGNTANSMQHLQYDQVVSESLRNQLNRFDILIDTIDQRNTRNMATIASERGYWSTIFGQASEIETYDEMSPERKAHRALELLEDYHSRLSEPQDRALRIAIERVIRIFKSRLFQALLGGQGARVEVITMELLKTSLCKIRQLLRRHFSMLPLNTERHLLDVEKTP